MPEWHPLVRVKDVAPNSPYGATVDGIDVVVVHTNDGFSIFQGKCPHQGANLANGTVTNGLLTCVSHGWNFSCTDGKKQGDSKVCLKRFTHRLNGKWIEIAKDELSTETRTAAPAAASRQLKDVPLQEGGIPFFGHMFLFKKKIMHDILEDWYEKHGGMYRIRLARQNVLVLGEVEPIQEALGSRPKVFRRVKSVEWVFNGFRAGGIFSNEGAKWSRDRALVMPSFNSAHLIEFFPTLQQITERFYKHLLNLSAQDVDFKILRELMKFTVDVTTKLAFGYDLNAIEREGDTIQKKLGILFPMFGRRINVLFPYWEYFKTKRDREVEQALDEIEIILENIVAETRKRMAENPVLQQRPTNFLEGFIATVDSESGTMTNKELFGNLITILLAGEDTTANEMGWIIHSILEKPELQQKMKEEADRVLGNDPFPTSLKQIEALRYIEGVTMEALRIKSVAPWIFLQANEDTVVGGVAIKKGDGVINLTELCARQNENFTRAEEFLPERWLSENRSQFPNHNIRAFMPFGGGPRYCPGRNLAVMEIKSVMAMLTKNFLIEKPRNGIESVEKFTFVTVCAGLWVKLTQRNPLTPQAL